MNSSNPTVRKRAKKQKNANSNLGPSATSENDKPNPANAARSADQPTSYEWVLARWTKIVGVFTGLLFLATGISAFFLWQTDVTLQNTLIFNQRAWISVDVTLAGPLVFDKDRAARASVPLEIVIKNTGLSPAQDVRIIPVMYLDRAAPITNEEIKETRCRRPRAGADFGTTSFTLFPGQSLRQVLSPSLTEDDLAILKQKIAEEARYFFAPPILVCVTYFAFVDKTIHFTTVMGVLFERNKSNPNLISGILLDSSEIATERLSLVPVGSFAD